MTKIEFLKLSIESNVEVPTNEWVKIVFYIKFD